MGHPVTRIGDPEVYLARRVLDALLREDYGGLRRHIYRNASRSNGHICRDTSRHSCRHISGADVAPATLRLPGGRAVRLARDGFLADYRVADDVGLDEVLGALRHLADPADDVAAFARECREALATLHLHAAHHAQVVGRLERSPTYYEVLGAYVDHPVYPTARCRFGLTEDDLRGYAPEFAPVFPLRWAALPRDRITEAGNRPEWWPRPADVGLPATRRVLLPVHPITARGLNGLDVDLAPEPYLEVTPTLSMRTVAVDAATHLKLPLLTSTLGLRNRRTIVPGTLHDGALVQRLLARASLRTPVPVVLADEQTYGHAADPLLGYLIRRVPPRTAVPVAALLAVAPGGRYVIEELTDDIAGFFDAYLRILFGWHVALFGYGIALEAHQQNISVMPPDTGPEPLALPELPELLVKDNDGALLDPVALARHDLGPVEVVDRRMLTADREALARVFVTITLHLCAGAIAFGLAERGLLSLRAGLGLVRARLDQALDEHGQTFLRSRTLDADRLPTKAMITAGTLVDKARTGALDINKHYGPPGPNYLRDIPCC